LIPVEEALEIVLANASPLPAEVVSLTDVLGRVLAEDVRADTDFPPFDRSAMDGYAVRAEDVTVAPVTLPVIAQVRAGQVRDHVLGAGQAVQIMTGAPVPPGATAVQQVEKTRPLDGGRTVEILSSIEPGTNISRRGTEVKAGDVVLARGERIDPSALAVLASVGQPRVGVFRRPRVSVLVTGDELVDVDETPGPGQIRNSNGYAVVAQAQQAGAEVRDLGIVPDDAEKIAAAMNIGLESDVLLLSGGVSEGVFDLVEGVMSRLGVEILFDKVAVKPGAPLVFGRRGATLVFGLPGNPVSAQVTFDLFVRPALLRMQGARVVSRPLVEAELLEGVGNRSGRKAHLPVRVRFEGGRLVARPVRSMGSGDLVAHARANAMVILEAQRTRAEAGERAPVLLLGNYLERDGAA
jgi:molybdopterin molybdotransferase